MHIGVIGINYKLADLKLREQLAKVCQRRFTPGHVTYDNHRFILLSTCNRTEIYFSSDDLAVTHSYILSILIREVGDIESSFDQKLYTYFGDECFKHLARVTSGLDSAIVGETEIQGQVKTAYEMAVKCMNLPHELHYLFQKSLKIGKEIRSKFSMGRGMPDVEHAIFQVGNDIFKNLNDIRILFVGASEINRKIILFLKTRNLENITLCNRSLDLSQTFVEKFSLNSLTWNLLNIWHHYDWIIFGTKASEYLISDIPYSLYCRKLIIDLSVPRNVEPSLSKHPNITLLNIDQINRMLHIRKQKMNNILTQAEQFVNKCSKRHLDLFQSKNSWNLQQAL